MQAQGISPVFPVPDLAGAVETWSAVLGVAPTFVDGDRWAQFDLDGRRLALAGSDRVAERPGLMVKVADLDAARARLGEAGLAFGPVEQGPHERRCVADGPGGWPIVLYAASPAA